MLLLRGYDTLSARAKARLDRVFAVDDPTAELSAVWGVKEQLRRLLNSATVEAARTEKMISGCYVLAADMEETWRLWATIEAWWTAIEVLIDTEILPTTNPVSCSPAPPDARREPIDQAGHHAQLRLAVKRVRGPVAPRGNRRWGQPLGGPAPTVNEETSVRISAEMYLKQRLVEIRFEELLDQQSKVLCSDPILSVRRRLRQTRNVVISQLRGILVEKLRWKLYPNRPILIVQLQAARGDVEICHMVSTPEELYDAVNHLFVLPHAPPFPPVIGAIDQFEPLLQQCT